MLDCRLVCDHDSEALLKYFAVNRNHFKKWEPTKPDSFYRGKVWNEYFRKILSEQESGCLAVFVAVDRNQNIIAAHCSLSQIFHGAFKSCYMGVGVAASHQGAGVGYELCSTAIEYAFHSLGLNRVMANYMPHNNRSAKLIQKLGFKREGFAKRYLKINGAWEDHVLNSLVNPDM